MLPAKFVERVLRELGPDEGGALCRALTGEPSVSVRLNAAKGLAAPSGRPIGWSSGGYWLDARPSYMVDVLVKRLSNSEDRIPLMISERLIDVTKDYTGEFIMASGQFRSYNRHEEHKNHLVLSVFVREVAFVDEELDAVLGELFARPAVLSPYPEDAAAGAAKLAGALV